MVFSCDAFDSHEEVVFVSDPACGLRGIIAVHSTVLGPAIGGCRILPYADDTSALRDGLRLSRGMAYKAAAADVPFGGGKAVVMADPSTQKSPELLRALGRFIDGLGGRYITGEDVGTTAADMVEIRRATPYVMGMPEEQGGSGDPSPRTALGCFVGIEASASHAWGHSNLPGARVLVQGLGNVGFNLCRLLAGAGATLLVSDIRREVVDRCVDAFGAEAVHPDAVIDTPADIYAPCALGGVINDRSIERLRVRVVAGGANNQLEELHHGDALRSRGILYAPDYVINAGGMIQLAMERLGRDREETERRVRNIRGTLTSIYRIADAENVATNVAADRLVERKLQSRSAAAAA
ncbi:MAG TPA: Glu/Leu/Phe/Val dehydrogenase dimerization domain-containing protein [Bradyrhizobium sp.]|uniref:Glu/Leu/Phe/Val family dehydrogenase n=1 Tax=Bradyrhizobium sp. TaxID=376 RepID=UPI002CC0BF5A|nr:Glu/Leu/Phe/Val dehydrogenase dimerization domain-containing protein [Bradyrhizobium sp.]HLZ02921.1 Glu/Leu/Phe/Val dehydrogenase dimerization domain-containing protein [Bradyrhizobium sp.]